jgi:hypothetical protein
MALVDPGQARGRTDVPAPRATSARHAHLDAAGPHRVRGDSSPAIRAHLRSRRITAVIPEPADQAGHRKRPGRPWRSSTRIRSDPLPEVATSSNPASICSNSGAPLRQARHRLPLRDSPPRRAHLDQGIVRHAQIGGGTAGYAAMPLTRRHHRLGHSTTTRPQHDDSAAS